MEDILLDNNGNFVTAADGDTETVSDSDCLLQEDVKHLLLTFPGDLWQHTEYGAGLQKYIHCEDTELNRLDLQQTIKLGIARDDRIDPESIKVNIASWMRDHITVTVTFLPVATAFELEDGGIPEQDATIVLTISQNGITFGGGAA